MPSQGSYFGEFYNNVEKGVRMSLNNEVRLIGNLVRDPDIIETERGKFGKIRIACNTRRGEIEDTLFMDIKLFNNTFKDLEYHEVVKGDRVAVFGRLATEEYTNKEGVVVTAFVVYANSLMKIARKAKVESGF
ncbi:MAG: single-stranded DNA-binding protein [Candidatus Bathyarchaeota archaeon]|nr:single-stranded DNA-binding protein [Candidatus Bathyarchaeota archaeon]